MKKKRHLSLEKTKMLEGYTFVAPFIIGTIIFFLYPLYVSIKLSFGKIEKMMGFKIVWEGVDNYVKAFLVDTNFVPMFLDVAKLTLMKAPLIIIFSLLLAMLVNKGIKFRGFFRTVFFIPFLLGMGEVMKQLLNQEVDKQIVSISDGTLISIDMLQYLGPKVIEAINSFFGIIVVVLWDSGVQILLFLSGLQSISVSLYESSRVDGATEWEMFWKITLPMISPIMLLNIIYTIVASFTEVTNPILSYIQKTGFVQNKFEYAAAIGWIYFIFIILLVLLVSVIMRNYIGITDVKGAVNNERKTI